MYNQGSTNLQIQSTYLRLQQRQDPTMDSVFWTKGSVLGEFLQGPVPQDHQQAATEPQIHQQTT